MEETKIYKLNKTQDSELPMIPECIISSIRYDMNKFDDEYQEFYEEQLLYINSSKRDDKSDNYFIAVYKDE